MVGENLQNIFDSARTRLMSLRPNLTLRAQGAGVGNGQVMNAARNAVRNLQNRAMAATSDRPRLIPGMGDGLLATRFQSPTRQSGYAAPTNAASTIESGSGYRITA